MLLHVTQFYSILLTFTQFMLIGYDDHCIPEEWCVDSNESPGFQCIHKSIINFVISRNFVFKNLFSAYGWQIIVFNRCFYDI